MIRHLHLDFLRDRDRHDAARHYWRNLCEGILQEKGGVEQWEPWFGIHQLGAQAAIEEGSIYSLHSPSLGKALNIEQYLPKSQDIEIFAFLDRFGEGRLDKPIEYLTIGCALSEESADIARRMIDHWVRESTTVQDMQAMIDRLDSRVE